MSRGNVWAAAIANLNQAHIGRQTQDSIIPGADHAVLLQVKGTTFGEQP